jgi:hypothetical protein
VRPYARQLFKKFLESKCKKTFFSPKKLPLKFLKSSFHLSQVPHARNPGRQEPALPALALLGQLREREQNAGQGQSQEQGRPVGGDRATGRTKGYLLETATFGRTTKLEEVRFFVVRQNVAVSSLKAGFSRTVKNLSRDKNFIVRVNRPLSIVKRP